MPLNIFFIQDIWRYTNKNYYYYYVIIRWEAETLWRVSKYVPKRVKIYQNFVDCQGFTVYDLAKVDEEADEHVDPVSLARGV